jgi:cbb3-type cytochrome oxidase subunit 3
MKAEERHELRENDLASWLQFGLWAFIKNNGSYFLLVLALAFLGYRLWVLYEQKQAQARDAAYTTYQVAESAADAIRTPEDWQRAAHDLAELIDTTDFDSVKAEACLRLGKLYNFWAAFPEMQVYAKLSRNECLSKSYEYFSKALTVEGTDPLIAAWARMGIASVYEDRGEWNKAKAEYQGIMDDKMFAGDLAKLAKSRLDTMDDRRNAPRLAEMIPPPPSTRPQPTAGVPSNLLSPGGLGNLLGPTTKSNYPDFFMPGSGTGTTGGTTTSPSSPAPYGPSPAGTGSPSTLPSILGGAPLAPTPPPATEPN